MNPSIQRRSIRLAQRGAPQLQAAASQGRIPLRLASDLSLLSHQRQLRSLAYILRPPPEKK